MLYKLLAKLLMFVAIVLLPMAFLMADGPRVNPRKGKVFFRKYCRSCHDGTTEPPKLEPITKTMEQWSREFTEKGGVTPCLPRVSHQSGKGLSSQDLLDIQAYLVQHAADSDQPATCSN